MISRGYSEYYPNNHSIKDSIHTLKSMTVEEKRAVDGPKMTFGEVSQPIQYPYSDPIVLTIKVGLMNIRRVLVDTDSTVDLITMDCLKQLKYGPEHFEKLERPLVGFRGSRVCPSGTIVLPVRFGDKGNVRTLPVRFTIVDIPFPYNIIMGLPLINKAKAVISTHQILIQYEKDDGKVGILYGNQKISRECQVNSLKMGIQSNERENESRKRKAEQVVSVLHVADDDTRKTTETEPVEGYEEVAIWGAKNIRFGKNLVGSLREYLIAVIR